MSNTCVHRSILDHVGRAVGSFPCPVHQSVPGWAGPSSQKRPSSSHVNWSVEGLNHPKNQQGGLMRTKSGLTDIAGYWVLHGPKHAQPGLRLIVAEPESYNLF